MKKVFISTITYNSHEKTIACLQSLEKMHTKDMELAVVVVDNASNEQFTIDSLQLTTFELHIIRSERNTGFAGGHNQGMKYALEHDADYIVVLNNDTTVDKHFISNLLAAAEKDPEAGVIAPKIYFAAGSEFHKERYKKHDLGKVLWYAGGEMDWENVMGKHRGVDEVDEGQYNSGGQTGFASGCCMFIPVDVIRKVGMFDERYFLYLEDSDLNERIKQSGYHILYEPSAVLWHANAGSTGGSGSALQDYFISRNRLLFGMRYAPVRTKIALLRESFRLLSQGREWQKKGIRDYFLKRFGKGSYPV